MVGGGTTGLVAAHEMLRRDPDLDVTVLEADGRLGGQVRAIDAGGVRFDVGAEAIHLGAPAASRIVRELGLADRVLGSRPGSSLLVTRRGLVPLPAGVGPAGPTKVRPVLESRILSAGGLIRAGLEPLHCRKHPADISVGDFVAGRFGEEVADAFVDPLLGNLHSGDVFALGLHSTAKTLRATASEGTSLLVKALRKPARGHSPAGGPTPGGAPATPRFPMFASWDEGLEALVEALGASIRSRATIRLNCPVTGLVRAGGGWDVETSAGTLHADDVVVAVGPAATASLLGPHSPATRAAMEAVPTASVATVVLGYPRDAARRNAALRDSNGLLLNRHQSRVLKAMTNMGRKWPMCDAAPWHLVRVSVGRSTNSIADDLGDAEMIDQVVSELAAIIGIDATPEFAEVVRWPRAMPQLGVGHQVRLAAARAELAEVGGLHLAGAAADGLGLGNTIGSGVAVAEKLVPDPR